MAITSLDGVVAGMQAPRMFYKTGITTAAVGGLRGYTMWYGAGNPAASTAASIGINGQAVTPALGAVAAGAIPRINPIGGNFSYLARLGITATTPGTLMLIDRLWHNSGLSVTSTAAQAITAATLPARDADGTTNGNDVYAAVEWSATGGAGTPTVTLTYTNQAGTTGRTATLAAVTTPPVGTFELFNLAQGDLGVRAPTSFIQSATRTSGTQHLVLYRMLATVDVIAANLGNTVDALTSGMPRIYDDSVLQLVWFPSVTTATNFVGSYVETQG